MLLGLVIGLGTTKLAAIAFAITLTYVILHRKRVRIPGMLWLVIACVGVTALWSPEPGKPVLQCCAIIMAYMAYVTLPRKRAAWGISLIAVAQIGVMVWQYIVDGDLRPTGLSRNASVIGLAGMYAMPLFPMAVMGGLSLSRTALLGGAILTVLNIRSPRYIVAGVTLAAISLTVGYIVTPERYYEIARISADTELRVAAIDGTSSEIVNIPDPLPVNPVEWRWYGYGFGNYYFHTGQIQPHNIFVRTWYELGLLSIPLFYALLWLWAEWGRDWRFLILAVTAGMLTDELIGSVEGLYMVLGFAIMSGTSRQKIYPDLSGQAIGWVQIWRRIVIAHRVWRIVKIS